MPTRRKKALTEPDRTSATLVNRLKPGQTPAEGTAGLVVAGLASNTVATREWSGHPFGDVDMTSCLNAVTDAAARVNRGDLTDLERLLSAQVITLNAVFTDLIHRAHSTTYIDHFDRYLRLGLKSQSMCRATCETIALLKNPPVFARQANIAHGPQQVNNGNRPDPDPALVRADEIQLRPSELLETATYAERMDGGTADTSEVRHSALAAVGTVHRSADSPGEGASSQERLPRRRAAAGAGADRGAQPVAPRRP